MKRRMAADRPSALIDTRVICCGDNIEELPRLPERCIDLIYIDPPWHSHRNYEVFWGDRDTQETQSFDDRFPSIKAYTDYMHPRCDALYRVLKDTGSFYYHCDWHASHYVRVMLDQIFGDAGFRNEIIWKCASTVKGNFGQGSKLWGPNTNSIFFYTKGDDYTFHPQFTSYTEDYLTKFYRYQEPPPDNRRYRLISMIGPGGAAKGNPQYECMGVTRYWRYSKVVMQDLIDRGLVVQTNPGTVPQRKQYLDPAKGVAIQTLWDDIEPLSPTARERLPYPTQKPLDLLERIINASSNENDVVLDAFCGCGTALVAAQSLKRQWIGIDVSPTACRVMAKRIRDECHLQQDTTQDEKLWKAGKGFVVHDLPYTEERLRKMSPVEFENWTVIKIGGTTNKAHVGDMGIDGRIYPASKIGAVPDKLDGELDFMDKWYPVQVKQEDKAGRPEIDAFEAAMIRAKRDKGFFVAFSYTNDAIQETRRFFQDQHKVIKLLTVSELLDGSYRDKLM
jgi:DNA modification methylase